MLCTIIPVKSLALAKGRLAGILTPSERRALVLAMLQDVLTAVRATRGVDRVGVVSVDVAALTLAGDMGAEAMSDEASDLNGALAQAATYYAASGAATILVLPADVPLISSGEIERLIALRAGVRGVALAPSRDGGTNALLMWPPLALPFLFGHASLASHAQAARKRGIEPQLFRSPGLELDVDRPDDLWALAERDGMTAAQRLVRELSIFERIACV